MRKTIALVLALVMIMSLATVYADAFTPPGQAKKNARLMTQEQNAWDEEELEERWGPWRLPFGLIGKGVPPGLSKRGLELPPGLKDRNTDELPPGIQMRFMNTMQERVPVEDPSLEETVVVDNLEDLIEALKNDELRLILLAETIVIDEIADDDKGTVIEGQFKTIRYLSEADIENMDVEGMDVDGLVAFDSKWLFEVEDEARLTLRDMELVGDGKKGDIDLVKVEAGAELVTDRVWFSRAHTAVKIYMDVDVTDFDGDAEAWAKVVDDAVALVEKITEKSGNTFRDVATLVLVVDKNDEDILEHWEDEE